MMPGYSRIDYISDQIRAQAPGVDWNVSGVDRARELGALMAQAGLIELWRAKIVHVEWDVTIEESVRRTGGPNSNDLGYETIPRHVVHYDGFAFDVDGRRFGYLGSPDRPTNEPGFRAENGNQVIAWSAEGHGNVTYVLRGDAQTHAPIIVPVWGSSSDLGDLRDFARTAATFFLSVAFPLAGIQAGASIGAAILGEGLAASYPMLANVIGNAAIGAAMNGGDVESAVKNAAIGSVAGAAGGSVGTVAREVANSPLVGVVSSAATQALITGGDIKRSVLTSVLQHGAGNVGVENVADVIGANVMDEYGYEIPDFGVDTTDDYFQFPELEYGYQPVQYQFPDISGSIEVIVDENSQPSIPAQDPLSGNPFSPSFGNIPLTPDFPQFNVDGLAVDGVAPNVAPAPNAPAFNLSTIVRNVSQVALAALSGVRAYRALSQPGIQPTARRVWPDGRVSVVGINGEIATRDPNGSVSTIRPPVGVPQSTLNGDLIVNNGDGTYTAISPGGDMRVIAYPDANTNNGSGNTNILLGLAAIFLASGKD